MDAPAGTPFTPSYTSDSSAAAIAAAPNPRAGSFGFAAGATPPSTGVAPGLFMPPRMTSAAGGLAPAPAVNPHAPLLQLSNVARAKKGKVSAKKKKKVDGSGSSKPSRKRLVGRVTAAGAPEAPASSLVEPPFDAQKFEVDEHGEGNVDASKGRGGNYTNDEDILLCNTWLQVSRDPSIGVQFAQNLFKGEGKKTKKGNINKGRPFTLPHCYEELKDDEKWKKRDGIDDVD
ncbi:Alternative oxidase 1a, mitochondrial [Hordeum vulgare]|nr:Alternative oxidase 1a, mitochondrial [Hordeum vulgare]